MVTETSNMPLGYALEHVSSLLIKQLDQILLEQLGIGYAQFKILRVLMDTPLIGQRKIADELGQTEASISRQMKLLHDDDLVETRTDSHNRRQNLSRLTRRGHRFTIAATELLERYEQEIFESLKPKEQNTLKHTLARIHEQTHETGSHNPQTYQGLLEQL